MRAAQEGAEYSYLTFLDRIGGNATGWAGCHLTLSRRLDHGTLMARRAFLQTELESARQHADDVIVKLTPLVAVLPDAHVFAFADHDILIFCCPEHETDQKLFRDFLAACATLVPDIMLEMLYPAKDFSVLQAIAERRFLGVKKMALYEKIANPDIVEALPLIRKGRSEPLILVAEDDRFTASYLAGFLKDFDLLVARNAEDAVLSYLEHAPDAAFIDIHLPGLSGHDALQAIKAADPDAFVVMLSVDTSKQNILSASEHGAVSYLKKPFSRERVLSTLRLSPFVQSVHGGAASHHGFR